MRQKGFSIANLLNLRDQNEAQGRLRARKPVAIIDIGSNSVRQVVYEGLTRAPSILFNEKVLCGLGTGVARDGTLEAEAAERALTAIRRFILLGKQMKVAETHILATAAVRDAENGDWFVEQVNDISGHKVKLLSGAEEAQYAALGIRSGFFEPVGIAGDQGGGSVEFISINGEHSEGLSTPLGALQLQLQSDGNPKQALKIATKRLKKVDLEWPADSRTFYAIGGTWRSLARLYLLETDHPVDVVHGFTIAAKKFKSFCEKIVSSSPDEFAAIEDISRNRRPLLPYGAAVMAAVIERFEVETVATSAVGLREGYLYSLLEEETKSKDALLEATAELSILRARSPQHSLELADWTDSAFELLKLSESSNQRRWRHAACNLADIVWRSASDFRAQQTLGIINNAGFNSIGHEGRAYLALVTFHRYQGLGSKKLPPKVASLASEETHRLARILAAMFRVLYLFSAAEPGLLPVLKFERNENGKLEFHVPGNLAGMAGEKPLQRIEHLGRELEEEISVEIAQ